MRVRSKRGFLIFLMMFAGAASLTAQVINTTNPCPPANTATCLPNGEVGLPYPYADPAGGFQFTATPVGGLWSEVLTNGASNLPPGLQFFPSGILGGTQGSGQESPTIAGTYPFTVEYEDSSSVPASFTMQIFTALQITSPATIPNATAGQFYSYTFTASGGDPAFYYWDPFDNGQSGMPVCGQDTIPAGMCLSPAGVLSGTPTTPGTYTIQLELDDNDIGNSVFTPITITVNAAGQAPPYIPPPPSLTVSGPKNLGTIALGGAISDTVYASGGTPPYTLVASGLPTGVVFGSYTSGGFTMTGPAPAPGVYSVGVTVTDSAKAKATTTIGFSVIGIVTSSVPAAITFSPYSFTIAATGGTMPYTFSGSGLPPKFSLSSGGVLSGTATAIGTYTISVTARDALGVSNSMSFSFAVTLPPPLIVPSVPSSSTLVNTPYSQTLSATGGAPPYAWTIAGSSVPNGTSLKSDGTLTGTPAQVGDYQFTARATDQTGTSAVGTFEVIVTAPPVTVTTPSPLSSGMANVDYPLQVLGASGGTPPYTFTTSQNGSSQVRASSPAGTQSVTGLHPDAASQNTLPAGLTLTPDGAISGTPTAAGSSTFTVTATDANGQTNSATLQITARPFSADLLLSAGSLSFSLAAESTSLPATQSVRVQSTDVTKVLSWSTTVTPGATWLSVTGGGAAGGTTPGFLSVALTSAASSLAASATPYQATIAVTCMAPSPCAGSSQTVTVSLFVTANPPGLTVPGLLSFSTSSTNPEPTTQSFVIQNAGGGIIGFASIACPATWCDVANSFQIPVTNGPTANVSVTADPTGLSPGYYYTNLTITTAFGVNTVPVTFFIAANSTLALLPAGVQLIMPAGGVAANPNASFLVSASSTSPLAWTAAVLPGAPWLNLATTSGGSTGAAPGAVSFSINQTAAAALTPQVYYGTIRISSAAVVNSPQDFEVVLDVTAATAPQAPNPSPAGLLFIVTAANGPSSAAPPPQIDRLFVSSATPLSYQASASTADGNPWLSVNPATGTTSAASPAQSSVTVSPAGLAAGVYHGSVSYALASAAVPTVNVTLIVEAVAQTPSPRSATQLSPSSVAQPSAVSCTPAKIVPTQTGLVNNFAAPASWPTPLEIQLNDDCGNPVANGQIVATFTNGDPPLVLILENPSTGLYSGTWTPRKTGAQVTVAASATAPGFAAATERISGSVVPNVAPTLTPNGTLSLVAPQVGAPLAPGTMVQIYGTGLAPQTLPGTTIPLANSLAGTSVIIGGLQAPLYFVSPGQINALIPSELPPGPPYQVIVNNNGALSTPETIQSTAVTPGVEALPSGYANAQHTADGSAVTDASAAKPGEHIVVYLTGMGATTVPVASGNPAPSSPSASTVDAPSITLNSEPVSFSFSGLTPGLAGLYQIDLQVPADAPNGDLTLVVNQPGFQGSPVILPVHQ